MSYSLTLEAMKKKVERDIESKKQPKDKDTPSFFTKKNNFNTSFQGNMNNRPLTNFRRQRDIINYPVKPLDLEKSSTRYKSSYFPNPIRRDELKKERKETITTPRPKTGTKYYSKSLDQTVTLVTITRKGEYVVIDEKNGLIVFCKKNDLDLIEG